MATKQAWGDFARLMGRIGGAITEIENIVHSIESIEKIKIEIVDDADRLAGIKEILDIHPDFSVNWVQARITKLSQLKTWLEDNGYL